MFQDNETKEMLIQYVQRIQKLDEEIANLREDKKEVLKEAKDNGFESKHINSAINKIRREKKKNPNDASVEEIYLEIINQSNIVDPV